MLVRPIAVPAIIAALFCLLSCTLNCTGDENLSGYGNTAEVLDIPDSGIKIMLWYGQSARIEHENLVIRFVDVEQDCRCPSGVECFWEGQAKVRFRLEKAGSSQADVVPTLRPGKNYENIPEYADHGLGYIVYLVDLEPYPDINAIIDKWDYKATLFIKHED